MAISVAQRKAFGLAGAANQLQGIFDAGIAANSIIVVISVIGGTNPLSSLVDSHSDAVTDSGLDIVSRADAQCFIKAFLHPTTAEDTITLNTTGNFTYAEMVCFEVAGFTNAKFDKFNSGKDETGSSTAFNSGSTGTLSTADEFVCGYDSTTNFAISAASPFDTNFVVEPELGQGSSYVIAAATTALTFSGVNAVGSWTATIATLMETPIGGGAVYRRSAAQLGTRAGARQAGFRRTQSGLFVS